MFTGCHLLLYICVQFNYDNILIWFVLILFDFCFDYFDQIDIVSNIIDTKEGLNTPEKLPFARPLTILITSTD